MQEQTQNEDDILDELLEDIIKEPTPHEFLSKLLESQSDCV